MMRLLRRCLILSAMVGLSVTCLADDVRPMDISRLIDARLGTDESDTARFAGDAVFLRRLTLDLAGRIPTISEVHGYLGNESESRHAEAIDRLMHSGVHFRNMSTFWRRSWVPQADTPEFAAVTADFELWLARRLQEGARYDDLVTEVITLDVSLITTTSATPVGFYNANQSKPENLAASSTRAFLGINLDCAQCHDHPFSRWTREQFWETAAFFAEPEMDAEGASKPPSVRIPDTELSYGPALLTREEIQWPQKLDSVSQRLVLADWMKRDEDRLLAKNAVNRLWAHFFGEAIIEPMDDLSRDEFQTGERARLLNDLAAAFIASGYDVNVVVEGIVGSNTYRLTTTESSPMDEATVAVAAEASGAEDLYATDSDASAQFKISRATIRGLTGEQLFDSLQTASGLPAERQDVGGSSRRNPRREFASSFYVERTYNAERSISQALALMNGTLVHELTSKQGNQMLASLLSSPFMTFEEQADTIFVAVLGRHTTQDEMRTVMHRFDAHPESTREQHLGNLFWVLVNSSEFNTNH